MRMREQTTLEGVGLALPGSATLAPAAAANPNPRVWGAESATMEIVAPDRFCARVFVELLGSLCAFELVGTGNSWVIRVQLPKESSSEGRLLLLVQRWLEACPLPCATIGYGGRRYLVRSDSTHAPVAGGSGRDEGRVPVLVSRGAKPGSSPPDRAHSAATTRAGFRWTRFAVTTP